MVRETHPTSLLVPKLYLGTGMVAKLGWRSRRSKFHEMSHLWFEIKSLNH
jgi:hypothetical protein